MNRCCAIAALIFGSLVQSAAAQPPAPEPPKSPIRLLPNYIATDQPKDSPRRSEPRPGPVPLPLETPPAAMPPWEHLMTAAEHLEAAGLKHESEELRARARRWQNEEQISTNDLRRELNRLQAELDALEKQFAASKQIEIRLKVIEFSEDQVRAAAPQFLDALMAASADNGLLRNPADFLEQVSELKENGLVRILSDPVLITENGRPASIMTGGEFPVPVMSSSGDRRIEWREFGVRVEAVAKVMSSRRLRLDFQQSICRPDFSSTFAVHGGTVPVVTTRATKSSVEMNAGEMMLAGAMRSERTSRTADGKEETETSQLVILVTADFVRAARPTGDTQAPPPATN